MAQQILIIHGGDAFDNYEDYIESLKNKEISLDKFKFKDWKRRLVDTLGIEYDVVFPQMPNSQNARYAEWKIWFEKILPLLSDDLILLGHSLGGIFITKYLSENKISKKLKAIFLVAAPFNTQDNHPLADFNILKSVKDIDKQCDTIYFYHSKDDQIVPFSNMLNYREVLPNATYRIFEDRQHFNQAEFREIISDILSL